MNNRNIHFIKILFITITFFSILGCSDEEEVLEKDRIPLFVEADMNTIHGNSEKSWRITEIINDYYDVNDALEIEISCVQDDVYTFSIASNEVEISLGNDRCFGENDDGVFIAEIELFSASIIIMDAASGNTIYLSYSQGFSNEDGNIGGVSFRHYALAELSENRMVFYRERGEFVGDYNEALIFERL